MASRGTHDGSVDLILSKSDQDHYWFFKWKLFFITYSCSLSRELSKTL